MKKKYIIEVEDVANTLSNTSSSNIETESENVVKKDSTEFMIHMYDQMFNTIDRTYKNIWEMGYTVGGGIGILGMYCKCNCYIFDIAVIAYEIGLFWILFRLIDANHWNNRNLSIIHHIEDKLLTSETIESVLKSVRNKNPKNYDKIHTSVLIQICFVSVIILFVSIFYLCLRYDFLIDKIINVNFFIIYIITLVAGIGFTVYFAINRRNKS